MGKFADCKNTAVKRFGLVRFKEITEPPEAVLKVPRDLEAIRVLNRTANRTEPFNQTGGISRHHTLAAARFATWLFLTNLHASFVY